MPGPASTIHVTPEEWGPALAGTDGPQLVLAGPGAGKTEFIARRASHLVETGITEGARILALTFSRRAAADLRHRVLVGLPPGTAPPHTATFHSLATRLLEAHAGSVLGWQELPNLLTGPEHVGVVARLLAEESPSGWPMGFREMLPTRTFAREVTDFLLRAAERRFGPADVERLAAKRTDWKALPGFMEKVEEYLRSKGRIDHAGVLAAAIQIMMEPATRELVHEQFGYVLVDEYQDTTDAQATLLQLLVPPGGNLTVTADVDQSIYSFRGADAHNVERFAERFAAVGEVTTINLTTSFRVPATILTAARRLSVDGLPGAPDRIEPSGPGGRVDTFIFDQRSHEAEWIANELERLHLEERVPYHRMAVLFRTKRRLLPELSRALDRRRIPHDRPGSRLVDHPAIRAVDDLVKLAVGAAMGEERTLRRLLLGPLVGLPLGAERGLLRDIHRGEGDPADLLAEQLPDGEAIASLLRDTSWATLIPAEQGFWHAWTTLPQWSRLVKDPARADYRTAWSSFSQVLGHLAERDPGVSLHEFLRLAGDDTFEATPLLRYSPDDDRLTLATFHSAKGLEFDVVVIADAVDGILPDMRRSYSLLNTNQLHPEQRGTIHAARFRIAEERRLAYTAMTRATSRVIWTATTSGAEANGEHPSRFMLEVAGPGGVCPPEAAGGPPVTGLEAESLLRRAVADPTVNPARRLAALRVLVENPHPAVRPVASFTGIRERGPDRGLLRRGVTFSPSQATQYETCPRQYALSRQLGIGDEPSVHMSLGSLVHHVAEMVDRHCLADPARQPSSEAALEILEDVFDPAEFGGEPWASAWKKRARELLTRLIDLAPPGGPVVAVEHDLELELDGATWRGRADRIDHAPDGSLRIVDYKTGSRMLTLEEAAGSTQLGFYVLAANRDESIRQIGVVEGAELWYPAPLPRKNGIATRKFDMDRLDEVEERLVSIASAIRAEQFPPSTGTHCNDCRCRLLCPEWPEGAEAFIE